MMLKRYMREREVKQKIVDDINEKIMSDSTDLDEAIKLQTIKRRVKLNGVGAGDVFKAIANVAVVGVIVGFELTQIMNTKASRFIKNL